MSSDPITEIAKEVAGQLPVKDAYDDALSPGMKQTGGLLEDVVKTVRLVLFPLQVASAYQDKFADFLKRSIIAVPEDQRIPPPNQILGPVLEGLKFEDEGGLLWEMFSHLLSNSMDESTSRLAHPAFPAIIRQLAPDEAIILRALAKGRDGSGQVVATIETTPEQVVTINNIKLVDADNVAIHLNFRESLELYLFHLNSLNLLQQTFDNAEVNTHPKSVFTLSPLGQHFMSAVTRGETSGSQPFGA